MQKIWQREWFGIFFDEFAKLDADKIADSEFYSEFYKQFYERYQSYAELDSEWLRSKATVAEDLFKLIKMNDAHTILSIGCGIGYIEQVLWELSVKENYFLSLTALEPAENSTKWLPESIDFRNGYFPNIVDGSEFDLAYCSIIDYAMTDAEYLSFLRSVIDFDLKEFLLINLMTGKHDWTTIDHLKELVRPFERKMKPQQFWGYLRSLEEQINLLNQSGFEHLTVGKHTEKHLYWISAK